ncbi:MAG: biotin--[acetyl-CoA-carboxylase] ligase [Candidatus Aminicenantes bacterium]|nr:biotin--[acetyl-CoA-carboxylase] ligase [Candidatus Aminicenantes bacterium]
MLVFTDNVACAESFIKSNENWRPAEFSDCEKGVRETAGGIFADLPVFRSTCETIKHWQYIFIRKEAPSSHFDLIIDMCRKKSVIPDGIVCLAGAGLNFHGQRKRPWAALEGNIHLTASLSPQKEIAGFGVGFPILAAVSLVETIDSVEGLRQRPEIKWVNDILIGGSKVAGFLAHTISMERTVVSVVLGIGLNVNATPDLTADPYVPGAASLRDFHSESSAIDRKGLFSLLLDRLSKNYGFLLTGDYFRLLTLYRKRSMVIGRRVRIMTDPEEGDSTEIASGRVLEIGENLELLLEGHGEPITKGRLILVD